MQVSRLSFVLVYLITDECTYPFWGRRRHLAPPSPRQHHHGSLSSIIIIFYGGQLVATERADGVTAEPLEDAVLVEDSVGARHGPESKGPQPSS